MPQREELTIPLRGLDYTTPGHGLPGGTCRTLENMIPVGEGERPTWEVPKAPASKSPGNLLGVARHSEGRLLGLREDELVVIDPANGFAETQVYTWTQPEGTRRMTTARLGESTFVAVTRNLVPGRPETLLWVRGTSAGRMQWPALPRFSLTWNDVSQEDTLNNERYVFRFAWELDDGSLGPTTGPIVSKPGSTANNDGWEAEITIQDYPEPVPSAWKARIEALRLIVHTPLKDDSGTITERAIDRPGYLVDRLETIEVGATIKFSDSNAAVQASEVYPGIGLSVHGRRAGTVYSYNKRFLAGDVAYDLNRPELAAIVGWEEGVSNANGDDYHLMMRVQVETPQGTVTRYSDALPFDATHAADVETKWGYLWYRDSRAIRWDWFVTDNWQGDVGSTTWKKPALTGATRQFNDALGAGYSYAPADSEPYDITATETEENEITDNGAWTDQLYSTDSEYDGPGGSGGTSDTPHQAEIAIADFTGANEDLNEVTVDIENQYSTDENGDTADASASGETHVKVLDSNSNIVAEVSRTAEGAFTENLTFSTLSAGTIRVETQASAAASASGDDYASATARAEATKVVAQTTATTDETVDLDGTLQQVLDRDGTRIVWSETHLPLEWDPGHVAYAGEDDHVLSMQATGQEVSAAQFGEYPILVFGQRSVRILQVGGTPFVQGVDLLTSDMGAVGRRAATPVDGTVVAALDGGVYELTPQLETPALSARIEDPTGTMLAELGADTAVAHFKDSQQGRDCLWVSSDSRTYRYDLQWGAWSVRPHIRLQYALRPTAPYAVANGGGLVEENQQSSQQTVKVQTALLPLGPPGLYVRVRQVQAWQPVELDNVNLTLVATDPGNDPFVKIGQTTLDANQYPSGLLPQTGTAPDVLIDLDGQATTGQQLEALYVEYELRGRRLRDHKSHPQTALKPGSSVTWP